MIWEMTGLTDSRFTKLNYEYIKNVQVKKFDTLLCSESFAVHSIAEEGNHLGSESLIDSQNSGVHHQRTGHKFK